MQQYTSPHGMTEGQKPKISKESGPKTDIIYQWKEREREVLD